MNNIDMRCKFQFVGEVIVRVVNYNQSEHFHCSIIQPNGSGKDYTQCIGVPKKYQSAMNGLIEEIKQSF